MKVAGNHPLLKPYLGRPAILDSNLLLLQWCASYDRELIGSFKRLNYFQIEDIQLLSETLKVFKTVRPHLMYLLKFPTWRIHFPHGGKIFGRSSSLSKSP
jgi:hypothetical protein